MRTERERDNVNGMSIHDPHSRYLRSADGKREEIGYRGDAVLEGATVTVVECVDCAVSREGQA